MADRRSFLGAVSGVAASVLFAAGAEAQPAPDRPSLEPSVAPATPAPSPSAKPPSAAARAHAQAMRAFDPQLSDAQLDTIARGIDANDAAGQKLNAKGRVLRNADEPAARFAVDAVA